MLFVGTRKVYKIGGSLMISLPPKFIAANDIEVGDKLPVIASGAELRITPIQKPITILTIK